MDNTELARIAYDAYRAHTGGVSLATGQPIPEWPQLRPEIQAAWQASAEAVKMAEPEPGFWGGMAALMMKQRNENRKNPFERAIAIARGCQIEYGGGYKDQREADAFHHGMTTVENCLRARQNPDDYQAALVEAMGRRELKREAEGK